MQPQPLPHALAVDRITKRYGRAVALDQVSLQVGRGTFMTLLGPSGSGKTTLLMTIAGFVQPDSGQLLLDGAPIQHLPPERRAFGMVFQGYALFPHLTVAENVAFPLRVRRVPKPEAAQRVREALDQVQLGALAARLPRQLSGGQQQRVALARALVFRPSLLLLDEPLSALDKALRLSMQDELKSLHQRVGLTFVYVTHDQGEALGMSDRIAILRGGRLVQSGTPSELYDRPASRFVAGFLGRSNVLRGRVVAADASGFAYEAAGQRFVQRGTARPGQDVTLALRPEKIGPAENQANQMEGVVTGCNYAGESWLVQLRTAGPEPLQLILPTWRSPAPVPGAPMRIGWDDDAAVPVTDDSEGDP